MNRLVFFKCQVYDLGWFPNTDSHIRTNNIPESHPRKKCPVHVVAINVICDRIVAPYGLVDAWGTGIGCNGRNSEDRKNGRLSV